MRKMKGIAQLKKELWKHFSLFVKLKYSEDGKYTQCYTCDRSLEIGTSNCQAGHWLSKKAYPVHYFHENNVRPQCYQCNINYSGNSAVFERRLLDEIGADELGMIFETRHRPSKRTRQWYEEKIEHYKNECGELGDGNMCGQRWLETGSPWYSEEDEKRMDIVGQNGNDGLHYGMDNENE